jgi:hypothetical protein
MSAPDEFFWFLPNPSCGKCAMHYFDQPFLVEAFASVGIEHGKSSGQMAEEYFTHFHKQKHRMVSDKEQQ